MTSMPCFFSNCRHDATGDAQGGCQPPGKRAAPAKICRDRRTSLRRIVRVARGGAPRKGRHSPGAGVGVAMMAVSGAPQVTFPTRPERNSGWSASFRGVDQSLRPGAHGGPKTSERAAMSMVSPAGRPLQIMPMDRGHGTGRRWSDSEILRTGSQAPSFQRVKIFQKWG